MTIPLYFFTPKQSAERRLGSLNAKAEELARAWVGGSPSSVIAEIVDEPIKARVAALAVGVYCRLPENDQVAFALALSLRHTAS